MSVHEIKILPEYFKAVAEGRKTYEIWKNDHVYQEGDTVVLNEWILSGAAVLTSMKKFTQEFKKRDEKRFFVILSC